MANKNYNEVSPHTNQNGHHKKKQNLQTINSGEDVEKKELCCTVGGNVYWYSQYGEQYGDSLKKKKLEINLPYDPAIPLLGIYPEKTIIQKTHVPKCSL